MVLLRTFVLAALLSITVFTSRTAIVVQAIAPPHPDYVHHEETPYLSLHEYRKRHNIIFNYVPQHISPEHCRFLTEEQCARDDEVTHARLEATARHRQMQKEAAASNNNDKGRDLQLEGRNYITQGQVKILVLLCRFIGHEDRVLPERSYYDELFNGGAGGINPVGGLSDWLFANSGGKYEGVCLLEHDVASFGSFLISDSLISSFVHFLQ